MESGDRLRIKRTPIDENHEIYPVRADKRLGRCLIINNQEFDHLEDRVGSNENAKQLFNVFHDLGFDVNLKENQTAKEMKSLIKEEATHEDNKDCSAFVFIVLTHGDEGVLYGKDFNAKITEFITYLSYHEIVELLSNINCKVLKGKPKLCFFHACNGRKTPERLKASPLPVWRDTGERLPEASDILMSFAAQEEFSTVRSEEFGGIYANILGQALMEYAWSREILEILCIVERDMRNYVLKCPEDLCLSTSVKLVGWSKKFYFNPNPILD